MYLDKNEKNLSNEYLENGYIIRDVVSMESLHWIRNNVATIIRNNLGGSDLTDEQLLNQTHSLVSVSELNNFRLNVIQSMNALPDFRFHYFNVARSYLELLVGNELAMQLRVNLSIQLPNDDSSLLPIHSDTWSGDSPYEIVVWLPLVDCFGTKSMYFVPPTASKILFEKFQQNAGKSSEDLFNSIKNDVKWLEIKFGQVLLFDQGYPHGNRINIESESRWTMNCRFKSVFTPYGDKKLGEFFEPITLRAVSRAGMKYIFPKIK